MTTMATAGYGQKFMMLYNTSYQLLHDSISFEINQDRLTYGIMTFEIEEQTVMHNEICSDKGIPIYLYFTGPDHNDLWMLSESGVEKGTLDSKYMSRQKE